MQSDGKWRYNHFSSFSLEITLQHTDTVSLLLSFDAQDFDKRDLSRTFSQMLIYRFSGPAFGLPFGQMWITQLSHE